MLLCKCWPEHLLSLDYGHCSLGDQNVGCQLSDPKAQDSDEIQKLGVCCVPGRRKRYLSP